LKSFYQNN